MIFYGIYDAGRVENIASVGHVVTTFRHLYFIPLYPVESRFRLDFGTDQIGTPIRLNTKSVFKGYAQIVLVVLTALSFQPKTT